MLLCFISAEHGHGYYGYAGIWFPDSNGIVYTSCSLGVVDLELSLSPDMLGLCAFDSKLPLTQMLPGSNPCELRLMLPDSMMGADGFHDVVIENMSASPAWRSSHVSPADVTSLHRRWPKAVFRMMQGCAKEVECLRRFARRRHFITMRQVFASSVEWTWCRPWTFI